MSCQVHGVFDLVSGCEQDHVDDRSGTRAAVVDSARAAPEWTRSFRPVLALMSGRTVGFVAAFLIPVVLARILDQAEFGTYKQLFLICGHAVRHGPVGMAESLFYFLPRAGEPGRLALRRELAVRARARRPPAASRSALGGGPRRALARQPRARGLHGAARHLPRPDDRVGGARDRDDRAQALPLGVVGLRRARRDARGPARRCPRWCRGPLVALVGAIGFAAVRLRARRSGTCAASSRGRLRPDAALFRAQLAYAMPFALAGPRRDRPGELPPVLRGVSHRSGELRGLRGRVPADPARRGRDGVECST